MVATEGRASVGKRFCGHCGAAIPAVPGPCSACGAVEWVAPPLDVQPPRSPESQAAYHTRFALLLLAVGVVASLLPVGAIIGDGLVLVGGVIMIMSSAPFGGAHKRNATVGLGLAFGAAVGSALSALVFVLAIPAMPTTSSQVPGWVQSLEASLSLALLVAMAFATVSGFGLLLITYSLQDRVGRMCLWLALALGASINVALYVLVTQGLGTLFAEAAAGQGLDVGLLGAILSQLGWFTYLGIIPNALFAGCYFLADTRIRRGVIPVAGSPTSSA